MFLVSEVSDSPDRDHVFVHLLQLLLRRIQDVRRRIEVVGFETLLGELDLEGLIIFLQIAVSKMPNRIPVCLIVLTSGTSSFSA